MKYILTLSLLLVTLISCNYNPESDTKPKYEYTIKFVVFYPNSPDTMSYTNNDGFYFFSSEGTNKICAYEAFSPIFTNTAPIKVISNTQEEIK